MSLSNTDKPDSYRSALVSIVDGSKNPARLSTTLEPQRGGEVDANLPSTQPLLHSASENLTDIGRGICLRTEVERFERELIIRALQLTKGHQKRAAQLLGLRPTTIHSKIKKYNLQADEWKPARS